MKKTLFLVVIFLVLAGTMAYTASPAGAVTLEKFIIDTSTPVKDLGSLKMDVSDFHHWTVNTRVKVAVLDYKGIAMGIDLKPAFDLNSSVLNANIGVFVRPFPYVEVYASHANDFHLGGGNGSNEANVVGLQLRFVDR